MAAQTTATRRDGFESLRHGSEPPPIDCRSQAGSPHPAHLAPGDHIFERDIIETRTQWGICQQKTRYRRRVVVDVKEVNGSWVWQFQNRMPAGESFVERLLGPDTSIRHAPPPRMPDYPRPTALVGDEPDWVATRWETLPETPPNLERSPKCLTVEHVSGQGSRKFINHLLAGGPDGRFDHALPGVNKWMHAFVATNNGYPYSVAVVAQPYNSDTGNGDGSEVLYLTRLCNHPNAPQNTSSYVLARIRGWLRHHTDVDQLVAIAGIAGNKGVCYEAADFTFDGERVVTDEHGDEWTRRRYVSAI